MLTICFVLILFSYVMHMCYSFCKIWLFLSYLALLLRKGDFVRLFTWMLLGWRNCETRRKVSQIVIVIAWRIFYVCYYVRCLVIILRPSRLSLYYLILTAEESFFAALNASSHTFMLLDPGGIECIACARKHISLVGFSIIVRTSSCEKYATKLKYVEPGIILSFWV